MDELAAAKLQLELAIGDLLATFTDLYDIDVMRLVVEKYWTPPEEDTIYMVMAIVEEGADE